MKMKVVIAFVLGWFFAGAVRAVWHNGASAVPDLIVASAGLVVWIIDMAQHVREVNP